MIPLFFALLVAQEKAIVEGTVVNAVTNEPLKKAHVILNLDGKTSYEVLSGEQGKFRFEGIAPEVYQLLADRQGFLYADEGWMEIAAGEHVEHVIVKMTPQSAIAGHVLDDDGDPVPEARIEVERRIHVNGRAIVFDRKEKVADEEGYFFAGVLPAGRYYVTVTPPDRDPSKPGKPGPEEDLVRTEEPVPIDVALGAVVRNAEVRVQKGRVFRIRGRAPNWRHGIPIKLAPTGTLKQLDENDAFEFAGVAPGNYLLNAFSDQGCPMHVAVTDHDIDDLVLEPTPGPTITGTIKIEGDGHFEKPPEVEFRMESQRGGSTFAAKQDGTFEGIFKPVKYLLDYTPPEGLYVKSVQFNHQPVTDRRIDLSSCASGTVEILVAPNAATISATVRDLKNIKVTLWNESTLKTRQTDDGAVAFSNLAPGEYRILAWEKVNDEYLEIPEFLARFNPQKTTLTEGSHESIELKLISKSASDTEVAKLQ
jgi:hypothetical protein